MKKKLKFCSLGNRILHRLLKSNKVMKSTSMMNITDPRENECSISPTYDTFSVYEPDSDDGEANNFVGSILYEEEDGIATVRSTVIVKTQTGITRSNAFKYTAVDELDKNEEEAIQQKILFLVIQNFNQEIPQEPVKDLSNRLWGFGRKAWNYFVEDAPVQREQISTPILSVRLGELVEWVEESSFESVDPDCYAADFEFFRCRNMQGEEGWLECDQISLFKFDRKNIPSTWQRAIMKTLFLKVEALHSSQKMVVLKRGDAIYLIQEEKHFEVGLKEDFNLGTWSLMKIETDLIKKHFHII